MGLFKKLIGIAVGVGLLFVPGMQLAGVGLIMGSVSAMLIKTPGAARRLQEQSVMVRSSVKAQEILYGEDRKSGVVVYFDTSGSENEYLWFVIAVVEHEIDSYTTLWFDDAPIDIATEIDVSGFVTLAKYVDADGTQLVKTGFYTGAASQTADADLVAAFTDWTTSHNGHNVAYFWVRLQLDKSDGGTDPDLPEANVWAKGYPRSIAVTAKGKKIYDPRLDDLNGGTGSHRVDTESTWEWSDNPVLIRTDYLRSSRFGPSPPLISSDIDWPTVIAHADICDELVSIPGSTTQKRYQFNGVVEVSGTPKSILESMQSADHGVTLTLTSGVEVRVGVWETSSHTIDDTWLAGTYTFTSAVAMDNAYNAVRGQFLSAADDYALIEFQPQTSAAYETEDGVGRVFQDVVLPFTNEEYAAQRLAIIELKKSRQQKSVQIQCNYRAELVSLYQIVTLDLPGFSLDTFRVIGISSNMMDGITTLHLREEVATDWTYDVADLATPPVIPSIIRSDDGVPPPTGLTTASGPDGIWLTWTSPSMQNVLQLEIYASATNDRSTASFVSAEFGETYFHQLPVGTVRYYWILARGRNGLVSTWHPTGATSGVSGTAGGENVVYYIKPLSGTAIKNGSGTLTIEAHKISGGVDAILSAGTIKLYDPSNLVVTAANGYVTGSDGYTGILDSGDISGAKIITLKDGIGGTALDTVSLVDIADGGAGSDAVYGYIEASNTLAWTRAINAGLWTPASLTTDLDVTFVQGGIEVARIARRITLTSSTGVLNVTTTTHKNGDLNTARVTVSNSGAGSTALTSQYDYSYGGDAASVAETVSSAQGGSDGATGASGVDGMTFVLSNAAHTIPTDSAGNNGDYTGSGTTIRVYEGATELNYDGIGTSASTWKIGTIVDTNITVGTTTDSGAYATIGVASAMTADTASIDYPISGKRADGTAFSITLTQTFAKAKAGSTGGGTSNPVQLTGGTVSDSSLTPTDARAEWGLYGDGKEKKKLGTASYVIIADWLISGALADYDVKCTVNSGTTPSGSANGSWLNLATFRYWYLTDTSSIGGVITCNLTIEIRNAITTTVIDTATVILKAQESA